MLVDTVKDMLFDLFCASASVDHVRRDLELMNVASSLLQALLTFAVFGLRLHLQCPLGRGGRDDLSSLVQETFDVPTSGGLIESILLFESLFQIQASDSRSHRFLCKL